MFNNIRTILLKDLERLKTSQIVANPQFSHKAVILIPYITDLLNKLDDVETADLIKVKDMVGQLYEGGLTIERAVAISDAYDIMTKNNS